MIPYERQRLILSYAQEHGLAMLDELAKLIPDASESTIRRDIQALEKKHQIEHLAGGAIRPYASTSELPITEKATLYTKEKERIASLALREVEPDDTVYLDSGSTCTTLLHKLLDMDIHIVTTNTNAIRDIARPSRAEVIVLGGSYNPTIASLYGPLTEENLQLYIFDKAFLGANGVDVTFGITTPHIEESAKKRIAAKQSKKTFVLADSSKFHHVANVRCIDLPDVTIISEGYDKTIAEHTTLIWQ